MKSLNHLMFFITFFVLTIFAISAMSGCSHCKCVPDDLSIEISEGGGATGFWKTFEIKSDFSVYYWNNLQKPDGLSSSGKMKKKQIKKIWKKANELDFFNANLSKPGNMSRRITIKQADKSNTVLWDISSDDSTAKKMNEFYNLIKNKLKPFSVNK